MRKPPAEIMVPGAVTPDGADANIQGPADGERPSRLDALKQRYTDDHPDVLAQEQAIRELQAAVEEEARQPRRLSECSRTVGAGPPEAVGDFQAEIPSIDRQLSNAQSEENRLKQMMSDVSGKIAVSRPANQSWSSSPAITRRSRRTTRPAPEAFRCDARRQPREAPDWRAVQDPGPGLTPGTSGQPETAPPRASPAGRWPAWRSECC